MKLYIFSEKKNIYDLIVHRNCISFRSQTSNSFFFFDTEEKRKGEKKKLDDIISQNIT
jgi:hypothetical protein